MAHNLLLVAVLFGFQVFKPWAALLNPTNMEGNEYRDLVLSRTGLKANELVCPREKSEMTPCVARDGDCVMTKDNECVGCRAKVADLLAAEKLKHTQG